MSSPFKYNVVGEACNRLHKKLGEKYDENGYKHEQALLSLFYINKDYIRKDRSLKGWDKLIDSFIKEAIKMIKDGWESEKVYE